MKITYIAFDGAERVVDARIGDSVMETAIKNRIAGIDGECGGQMACGTCHVYVPAEWLGALKPKSSDETAMLDFNLNTESNSRLSCQIKVTEELEGLVVHMPSTQHP